MGRGQTDTQTDTRTSRLLERIGPVGRFVENMFSPKKTCFYKKSRIRETKHLSTDTDSSTDTTVRLTKNSRKPNFFEKRKKSSKTQKLKKVQRYANISDIPFDQRSLIHREAWFPPCFVRQNQQKNKLFFARRFQTTSKHKCLNVTPLLSITFPQGFRISKNIGHPTSGSGGKKTIKRYLKSEHTNKQTNRQTYRYMDISTYRKHRPRGPML